jgi:single-strand DNA-binding protein
MPALNHVQLIGYLGRDPESKYTPTGKRVTDFPIAITNRWKGEEGELKEYTEWVNIETWGRLAEICHEYLAKGSLVYVAGRLKTNRYEEDGETRYFTKVVAKTVQFLPDGHVDDDFIDEADSTEEEETELTPATSM